MDKAFQVVSICYGSWSCHMTGGKEECDCAFQSSFSMSAFLPSSLSVWGALLPTHFLHLSERRSWFQTCLPLPIYTHKCVWDGAEVKTEWWKWYPIPNVLFDEFSRTQKLEWGHWSGSVFMSSVYTYLFSFLLLQSPNVSALMQMEARA